MARRVNHIALRGGLDLVSSPLFVDAGRLWSGVNFECVEAGYRRVAGFERFDGRASPSDAEYWLLGYTLANGQSAAAAGDALTGAGGFSAHVLKVEDDAYVLGELTGTVADDAALTVNGTAAGSADGTPRKLAADTIDADFDYRDLAATHRRTAIAKVPGSGPVRGVWHYHGDLFAVRDNATATAGVLHRATPSGWTAMALGGGLELRFDAGNTEIQEGAAIRGFNSGATATVVSVTVSSGTWGGNNAAGTLVLRDITGTFRDNEFLQANNVFATVNGTLRDTTRRLPAGGTYRFINHNFAGQAASLAMVGVNGVGPAFQLARDAAAEPPAWTFTPIETGHADDRPTHVAVQRNHLLLAYRGGSLIVSETGNPLGYTAAKGAAEIAAGQDINGLLGGVGLGNTVILGDDHIQVLYGNDSEDFQLIDQSQAQTGGVEGTLQSVGGPIYLDNRGVRSLTTTEAYGNWVIGTMTAAIQPWIDRQRNERNRAVGSMRVRSRDQYRLWWESGVGVCLYVGRGKPELSFLDYGTDADDVRIFPRCSVSAEDDDRIERVWFGADNGYVYEADRGRSFDGAPIRAFARFPLNHVGLPSEEKRFFGADLHLDLESRVKLSLSALFDDGAAPDQSLDEASIYGGGGLLEEGFYDEIFYDSPLNGYARYPMEGIGRNASILVLSETKAEAPHTLNGMSVHWARRRALRI